MSSIRRERLRAAAPFACASLLPLLLLPLPGATWDPLLFTVGMVLIVLIWAYVVLAPRDRLPRWLAVVTGLAFLGVIALLRHSGGGNASGLGPMVLVPVMWFALYGRPLELWSAVAGSAAVYWVPIVLDHGGTAYPDSGWRIGAVLLTVAAIIGATVQRLRLHDQQQTELLSRMAHTDALTGLPNRRSWEQALEAALSPDTGTGTASFCIAVVDLDGFKAYNDLHGHQAGDRMLKSAAAAWRRQLRHDDVLARLGGDEFAVLMPRTSAAGARAVLERFAAFGEPASCSIGVAQRLGDESGSAVIRRADLALYEAKRDGGGLVATAT